MVIEALFAHGYAFADLQHSLYLVGRVRDIRREQLRSHALKLLIRRVHGKAALVDYPQCAEGAFPEVVPVRDICFIRFRERNGLRSEIIFYVLVGVVELIVYVPAVFPCRLKKLIFCLLAHRAGLEILLAYLLCYLIEVFLLREFRNIELVRKIFHKRLLRPFQVSFGLFGDGVAYPWLLVCFFACGLLFDRIPPAVHPERLLRGVAPAAVNVELLPVAAEIFVHAHALGVRAVVYLSRLVGIALSSRRLPVSVSGGCASPRPVYAVNVAEELVLADLSRGIAPSLG